MAIYFPICQLEAFLFVAKKKSLHIDTSQLNISAHVMESGIREILACGIRDSGLWNPESNHFWTVESGIQDLESEFHSVESRIQGSLEYIYLT